MDRSYQWKIFSIRKVAVTLHISLLVLLFYIFIISSTQFPSVVQVSGIEPLKVTGSPTLWGIIFTFSLLASIFIHEFSHVLVAQRQGGKVRQITLMMLGGVSEMESLPQNPATEFKVAVIGPVVSLGFGILLYNIHRVSTSDNVVFFGYWIGQLNIILGIFNLLPAFPTDGGRILRSFLVSRQGQLKGTQNAVKVSGFFSFLFGVIGLLEFNIILIFIGLFIYASSKTELFTLTAKAALTGLKARDLVVLLPSISESASLSDAAAMMLSSKNMFLPVLNENKTLIINAHDLNRVPKRLWDETPVVQAETIISNAVDIDDSLENVLKFSFSSGLNSIPVLDHQKIIGMIRLSDLLEMVQLRQLA